MAVLVTQRLITDPFHNGIGPAAGKRADAAALALLRALHTLCRQLTASLDTQRAEHDRTTRVSGSPR